MSRSMLSDRQINALQSHDPEHDAFCDLVCLSFVTTLSIWYLQCAVNPRAKPPAGDGPSTARCMTRLPAKKIYRGLSPIAVLPYESTRVWLKSILSDGDDKIAAAVVQNACWRLANRITRGSRERTPLAKAAFKAFKLKWPDDVRLARYREMRGQSPTP